MELLDLPDELLLEVAMCAIDNHRGNPPHRPMAQLALTNRRLSSIVRSAMDKQESTSISVRRAYRLMRKVSDSPRFAHNIKSLEITTFRGMEVTGAKALQAASEARLGLRAARNLVNAVTILLTDTTKALWCEDLMRGLAVAYIGLLLATMPNLKQLILGPGKSEDNAIFHAFMLRERPDGYYEPAYLGPDSGLSYMRVIMTKLFDRLHFLELPSSWHMMQDFSTGFTNYRMDGLSFFTALKRLVLPAAAILRVPPPSIIPDDYFPPLLEDLIVVNATPEIIPVINHILHIKFQGTTGECQRLKRIAIYFMENPGTRYKIRGPESESVCPGLDISIFSPKDQLRARQVFGQPWKLTEDELLDVEARYTELDRAEHGMMDRGS